MYTVQIYENIEELKEINENLAEQITYVFDEKTLKESEIFIYPSLEDFAKYEVEDLFYPVLFSKNYNILNLLESIDYNVLGEKLKANWDESSHYYEEETDTVVVINQKRYFF
jgi:hypothetical protein